MTPAPKPKKVVKTVQIKSRLMGLASSRLKDKPKKVQPAVQRKKTLQRLEFDLDLLWGKLAKKNWGGKCAWPGCPNTERLASHHFIHKSAGRRARWEEANSCLLCFGCHIYKVHQRGNTEPIREEIIKRIGLGKFERMVAESRDIWKPTLEELQELKQRLSAKLEAK